jgi:hypothetical protein
MTDRIYLGASEIHLENNPLTLERNATQPAPGPSGSIGRNDRRVGPVCSPGGVFR